MPAPDFVLALREKIGHDLLWMPGVTAVVVDTERTRALAVRRADNGAWTPVTGIVDPGEQPAVAAVREVAEEAGIRVRPLRLASVTSLAETTHVNGDRAQYLDLCFLCEHIDGDPHPADGENTEARWFPIEELPPMNDRFTGLVRHALLEEPQARFLA